MNLYATFWDRIKAFAWDYLVILIYILIISILFWFIQVANTWLFANRITSQLTIFFSLTLPIIFYFTFAESSIKQASFGKQKMGLKVSDANGNQISFFRALIRNILKFLSWEISHTLIWQINFYPNTNPLLINIGFGFVYLLIGLNILCILITKTRQTLYDLIMSTFVIKFQG